MCAMQGACWGLVGLMMPVRDLAIAAMQRQSAIKDQFLATMSHEMRTPLHGILGLARLTLERLPDEPGALAESRHPVALMERAGQHLLHIINDVLGLLQANATEKALSVWTDLQLPPSCWVMGDAARVRQMLHNLLGNAIKFTDSGEVGLRVMRNPGSDALCFQIHDTGMGIPEEEQPLIFEAFHQVEGSLARRHKGTGLGLLTHQPCPFQLVLMDLQMPRLDGFSTCRRLRQWEQEHGVTPVPVVALTANALSRDRALCMAAGMDGHLPKPFQVEELLAVLQRHLGAADTSTAGQADGAMSSSAITA